MGPHPLWLLESLCERKAPGAGSAVLDLGCGKALTSAFLAREFDVFVTAADWWTAPESNQQRLAAADVGRQVVALRAEAHNLPFADQSFDAIVSIDAYHYFGTADLYLSEMTRLLRPGGWIGIVVPGVREEQSVLPPPRLADHWDWDFCSFHSPAWWRHHWEKSGLVAVRDAWWLEDGQRLWHQWAVVADDYARCHGLPPYEREVALLEADDEQLLGFSAVIAEVDVGGATS